MTSRLIAVLTSILLALTATAGQGALWVDFNDNDAVANPPAGSPPSPTQAGFIGVTQAGGTFASDVGVGGMITLSMVGSAASQDDRDRGALTGGPHLAQSDLLRDFIFRSAGTGWAVTLTTLQAGEYEFTGFFHDNTVQQGTGTLSVDVGDGLGEIVKVPAFEYSTGFAPDSIGSASFKFTADGSNPVTIFVRDLSEDQPYVINGFTLTPVLAAVPEPSNVVAWAFVGLGALIGYLRFRPYRAHEQARLCPKHVAEFTRVRK